LMVPALLYSVQNNLLFVALAHLTAAVYTVSYQLKTLTTALFSVLVLRRELSHTQWFALALLSTGVALLQLPEESLAPHSNTTSAPQSGVSLLGMAAVCGASVTSGFCGVYMEKLLKQSKLSLWMRNVQLALAGAPISLICALATDHARIGTDGVLQGFDGLVWGVVAINALGGLAIAAVLRYADNIVKCFATAAAVLVSCLLSNFMGELVLSNVFITGTSLVAVASVLYGLGANLRPHEVIALCCPDAAVAICCTETNQGKLRKVATILGIGATGITAMTMLARQLDLDILPLWAKSK